MLRRIIMLSIFVVAASLHQPQAQTKLACIGTSITYAGNYTRPLAEKLGVTYSLRNFGISGVTVVRDCTSWLGIPGFTSDSITNVINWAPDICTVELGANDPINWPHMGSCNHNAWYSSVGFTSGYNDLLDSVAHTMSPVPRILLCLPTPQANMARDSLIRDSIIPIIRQIAAVRHFEVIDLHTPLESHPEYFPDGLHPNTTGGQAMAEIIYQAIIGTTGVKAPGTALPTAVRPDHIRWCCDIRGRSISAGIARAQCGLRLIGTPRSGKRIVMLGSPR
jgi:hypothetical protein